MDKEQKALEINKIHLGDCYELIKQIPSNSVDLVYTDIPYLFDMGGGGGFLKTEARKELYKKELVPISHGIDMRILDEFVRVCKKTYCYIWCSKEQILPIGNYFVEKGCSFNLLVWCKPNPTPFANNTFLPDIEYCLCLREQGTKLNNGIEHKSKWYLEKTNVSDKKEFKHPTIKPLPLVKRHLLHSTNEGDLVLDAFMGSGTTAVACKELNRNFIGFEINEEYHKIACDRLNGINAKGQTSLFDTDFDSIGAEKHEQIDLFGGE